MSFAIYNEDCLEGMKRLADKSVDLIVTDPPFAVGLTSNGIRGTYEDLNLLRPFWELCLTEWRRVLKDGAQIYVNTDWRTYPFLYPILQKFFVPRNLIVWDLMWLKAGNFYRYTHELIIFASNGEITRTFSPSETDIWRIRCVINRQQQKRRHPAEKPVELCEKMIRNSSREGDTVLDCFAGSGTTGVACVNTNRNFVGFEIDERFFNVAQKRIDDAENLKLQSLF